ncbi:hypothetical protein [Streptomyces sp. NPDC003717]|uniref:hypothetical protein n=1 Tax=Streptomyces sp. NPDC003717 TaxID=3154276 RepID=UPI0033A0AE58
MSRRPSRPVRLAATALTAGALLATAACTDDDGGTTAAQAVAQPTGTVSASPSPGALTASGAKAALLTEGDLEGDWNKVSDPGSWRDSLLVGKVDVADFLTADANAQDCQRLMDGLYGDDLLGKPSGASALAGFSMGDSRLLEQVAAYDRSSLDDSLKWLASLPQKCDQFTATDSAGGKRTVQVTEASLPKSGDARQGLHVVVQGTSNGTPATLTLDVAAVRVGTDAVLVTGGGLDGGQTDSVTAGARTGTDRLKTVLSGKTPSSEPGGVN